MTRWLSLVRVVATLLLLVAGVDLVICEWQDTLEMVAVLDSDPSSPDGHAPHAETCLCTCHHGALLRFTTPMACLAHTVEPVVLEAEGQRLHPFAATPYRPPRS